MSKFAELTTSGDSEESEGLSPQPIEFPLRSDLLEQSVGYCLRRAQFSTWADYNEAMEPFDIRPSQFAVLALIRSNPGASQSAIASSLGIRKPNFVNLLNKLERRGFTERRKGGDRRRSSLHLTAEGEQFMELIEAAHSAMETRVERRLGKKRTRALLAALQEFVAPA